ncbi:pyridoxamine 5'-phosphate oxidase family protein [Halobellus clavatus]|jgi:nitroimidazol reductase NimA-like FMN-containing flavoprotein (pyridoxamine 5'-phosphate oxidase superfamily)|uniref:Pyridoxamine 5'-phosphate oxidase n=1 Tax=Halobellus clavatus TaxID=660517 RepID=A0A1H3CKI6_9EURY|nr:pyridoxamine 5'-phosphate oxidase family protein [Halobellus clavatus]SDX54671.1 Pyridoxamine 5'-phosphate oxidase [Halobellus clavatus]
MPRGDYGVAMDDKAVASFLTSQGHGVLSFGGDVPYSLPISFGYDVLENRCIFQLVFHEDSEKSARLEASNRVSLVAYEWNDPSDWRSVVVEGRLQPIEEASPAAMDASEIFAEFASLAGLSVFDRPSADLDPAWYELEITKMKGREAPSIE